MEINLCRLRGYDTTTSLRLMAQRRSAHASVQRFSHVFHVQQKSKSTRLLLSFCPIDQ